MSRCEEYQELISRMVDDELTTRQKRSLEEHIRNCPECAALYSAFSALSRQIGNDLEDVPLDLRENVMAEVRREEIRRRNRLPHAIRGILAAAACIAVIVGVSLGVSPRLRGQISAAAYPGAAKSAAVEEPMEAARGFEGVPEEKAWVMEEPEAPQAEEALAAPDLALPEAAAYDAAVTDNSAPAAVTDDAENDAEEWDLSGWMDLQMLRDLLGGKKTELAGEDLGDEPTWRLLLKEGRVSVFEVDGVLYYVDPADDSVMQAQLSPDAFRAFLGS